MVQGRADPERDGVADYVRHLTAALRDAGENVLPVPVLGPREAAERLRVAAARHRARPVRAVGVRLLGAPRPVARHGARACPSSPPCTSTAGGRRRAGCPARCGGRWSAPGCGTARPGGSSRAAAPCSPRTPATRASLQERFGRTAVQVPLAPNVPDLCGLFGEPADRDETRRRLGVPARRPGRRVLRVRAPGQGPALPHRGAGPAARRRPEPAPADPRRLHLARPARAGGPRLPRGADGVDADVRCGPPRHDHRAPAGRGGLGRAARGRHRRLPVHRGRHHEERGAAVLLRARPAHPRHRGGPARSRPRRRHLGRRRAPRPRRAGAGRRPGPAARRRAAAS